MQIEEESLHLLSWSIQTILKQVDFFFTIIYNVYHLAQVETISLWLFFIFSFDGRERSQEHWSSKPPDGYEGICFDDDDDGDDDDG